MRIALHPRSSIMKKKSDFVIIPLFVAFLLFTGCRKPTPPKNFILITLDTQRSDFLSCYNPHNASTPNLDWLAQKGILYENCYSLIPITLPSHASIFFSEPPHAVKNYNNGQIINRKRSRPSFVNLFKKNNFQTGAFVSLGILKSIFGLNEGFDTYEEEFPANRWYLSAEEVNACVFPWLEKNIGNSFFAWIHYSDPHDPYSPPRTPIDFRISLNGEILAECCLNKYETHELELNLKQGANQLKLEVMNDYVENPDQFKARLDRLEFPQQAPKVLETSLSRGWYIRRDDNVFFFKNNSIIDIFNYGPPRKAQVIFRGKLLLPLEITRRNYREEVEYMDAEIGKLWEKLENLGLMEKTAILIVGDHGEGLGEYLNSFGDPHIGHIHFLNEIYMKVPLIIYNPGSSRQGIRVKEPVSLLDIAPTVTTIMGWKRMSHFRGRNLLCLKKNENIPIYEETYRPESFQDRFALLHLFHHLIYTPETNRYELFDLRSDPEEKTDVYEEKLALAEITALKKNLDSFVREVLKGKEEIKVDKKHEEMLRALGYIR